MSNPVKPQAEKIDMDDIGHNPTLNETFESILSTRLNRRDFLLGSLGTGAMAVFGGVSMGALSGCAGSAASSSESLLAFGAVAKNMNDAVTLPSGYSYSVLCALGDPLATGVAAYANDGSDDNFENRFGDHHDGMEYFGLSSTGTPDSSSSTRALIGINHEATTDETLSSLFLHPTGGYHHTATPCSRSRQGNGHTRHQRG